MPQPVAGRGSPPAIPSDRTLWSRLQTVARGLPFAATRGVFDQLFVRGDIDTLNLTARGSVTPHLLKTNYKARLHLAGAYTPANAETTVPLDAIDFDPGGNCSTANHSWTCPVTGFYLVTLQMRANALANGAGARYYCYANLNSGGFNGARSLLTIGETAFVAGQVASVNSSHVCFLRARDVVTLIGFSSVAFASDQNGSNFLSVHYLSS